MEDVGFKDLFMKLKIYDNYLEDKLQNIIDKYNEDIDRDKFGAMIAKLDLLKVSN